MLKKLDEEKEETVYLNSNLKNETSQALDEIYNVLKNYLKIRQHTLHLGIIKFIKKVKENGWRY